MPTSNYGDFGETEALPTADISMRNPSKSLPESMKLLELLLEQANRVIDYIEPIMRSQRFRAEQLQSASEDLLSALPMVPVLQSITSDLRKHTALDGPDIAELMKYVDGKALGEFNERQEAALARFRAVARAGPITPEAYGPAGVALAELVDVQSEFLELAKTIRREIVCKLENPPTAVGADNGADNKQRSRAQLSRLPANLQVLRLAAEIRRRSGNGVSQRQVAIEFTEGDTKRADSLLRQLRRFPALLEGMSSR